ncbi:MAG: GAF domain-containing sensor histidine kinase [Chloroflexi bacterium]|nr:GAF domain-containing sensor histidine kinase [Chloroflexota bacterium]
MQTHATNPKILKIVTIGAPPLFVALFELARHTIFVERSPTTTGILLVFAGTLVGAFFFSRFVFGLIDRFQQESVRRSQELAVLNSVALAVSDSLNLDVVLYRALDKVLEVTGAEAGEMFLLDEQSGEMVRRAHSGVFPEAFQQKTRFRLGEGLDGKVAQSGQPVMVRDLSDDPELGGMLRERKSCSLVSVPLRSKDSTIGVVNLLSLKVGRFAADDTRLLMNMGNQIAVAVENARLHERVQSVAALEERERIAREMHDGLAQVLSYVNTKSQAVRMLCASGRAAEAEAQLIELENVAQEVYADVREAILGLRATASKGSAIVATLKEYIFRFSQMSGIRTELEVSDDNLSLPKSIELQVIRIIQEALTNARKHAKAITARVRISSKNTSLQIVIQDDGVGFNHADTRRGEWPQFGLQTMRERAESIGGNLEINSAPGKGTRVTLRVPLPAVSVSERT